MRRKNYRRLHLVGFTLLVVILAIMVVIMWYDSTYYDGWLSFEVSDKFVLASQARNPQALPGIVAFHFFHVDWEHLLGNAVSLIIYGSILGLLSPHLFIRTLLANLVVPGAVLWCVGDPEVVAVGASVLAASVCGALLALTLARVDVVGPIFLITTWSFILTMFLRDIAVVTGLADSTEVYSSGHLIGLLSGFVICFLSRGYLRKAFYR